MKYLRFTVLAALIILASVSSWAQSADDTVFGQFPDALGAYINTEATGGLTWQHWAGPLGLRVTGGGLADTSSFDYNVQAQFQYMLYGEDFADWFSGALYAAGMLGHRGTGSASETGVWSYDPVGYLGLGVGMELVLLRHLAVNLDFLYVGQYAPLELNFAFGGGLMYRF